MKHLLLILLLIPSVGMSQMFYPGDSIYIRTAAGDNGNFKSIYFGKALVERKLASKAIENKIAIFNREWQMKKDKAIEATIDGRLFTIVYNKALESSEIDTPAAIHRTQPKGVQFKNGLLFFEQIGSANAAKDELFSSAKKTFIRMFKDSKHVIKEESKEDGRIIGKGYTEFWGVGDFLDLRTLYRAWFILQIDVKDNKYRIQLYDFSIEGYSEGSSGYYVKAKGWYGYPLDDFYKLIEKSKTKDYARTTVDNFTKNVDLTIIQLQSMLLQGAKQGSDDW